MAATVNPDTTNKRIDQEAQSLADLEGIQTKPRKVSSSLPQLPTVSWDSPVLTQITDPLSDPKLHVRPPSSARSVKRSRPGSVRMTEDALKTIDQTISSSSPPLLSRVTEGSIKSEAETPVSVRPENWVSSDFSNPADLRLIATSQSAPNTDDTRRENGEADSLSPGTIEAPKASKLVESKQETTDSLESVYKEALLDISESDLVEKKESSASAAEGEQTEPVKKVVRIGAEKHRIPSPPPDPKRGEPKRPPEKKRNALPVRTVPSVSNSETSIEGSNQQKVREDGLKNQRERRATVAAETKVGDKSLRNRKEKWEEGDDQNKTKPEDGGSRRKRLTTDTTGEPGEKSPNVDASERKALPPPRKLVDLKDDSFQFALDQFITEKLEETESRRSDLKQKLRSKASYNPDLSSTLDVQPNRYTLTIKDDGDSHTFRRDSSEGLFDRPVERAGKIESKDSINRTRARTPTPIRASPRSNSPSFSKPPERKPSAKKHRSSTEWRFPAEGPRSPKADDRNENIESYAVDEHKRHSGYRTISIHTSRIPRFKRTRFKGISTSMDYLLRPPNAVMDPLERTKAEILKRTSLKHIGSAKKRVESGNFLAKLERENADLRRQISALGKLIPKEEANESYKQKQPSVQEIMDGGESRGDWEAGATLEDKLRLLSFELKREQEEKQDLQERNKFLNIQVNTLRKRVNREIEKAKMTPRLGNTRIPISVEANMNLRYQFKQKLEAERTKYAKLEDEHKMVAAILRDMQIELNRKNINVESQRLRMNGIAFWQKKHRDVENEKHDLQRLYDTLNVKLEKQARENERLKLEILHMTDQLSHLHGLSTIPEELECNRPTTMRSSQENLLGSTESDRELKVHQAVRRHRQVGTKSVVSGKSTMVGGNDVTKDKRLSVPLTGRPSVTTEDINKGTPWSRRPTGIDPKVWNSKSNQRDRVGSVAKKQQNGTIQEARRAGNSRIQSRDTELRQSEKLPSIVLQEVTPEEFVVRVEPRDIRTAGRYEIVITKKPNLSPDSLFENPKSKPSSGTKLNEKSNADEQTNEQLPHAEYTKNLSEPSIKESKGKSSGNVDPPSLSDTKRLQQSAELQNALEGANKPPSFSDVKTSQKMAEDGANFQNARGFSLRASKIPLKPPSLNDTKTSQLLVDDVTTQDAPASTVQARQIPLNTSSNNRGRSVTVNKTISRSTGALPVRRASHDSKISSEAVNAATKTSNMSLLQAAENDERLRAAKVQIEYKTWVKDKA